MLKAEEIIRYEEQADSWDRRADAIDNDTYGGLIALPYEEKIRIRKKANNLRRIASNLRETLLIKLERNLYGKN